MISRYAFLVFSLVLLGRAEADNAKPVIGAPEGQRAFDDLAKSYASKNGWPDYKTALADLKSPDASTAQRAGNYLLALFEQSLADESNGRADWRPTPFWGEGPDNRAHDFRHQLAGDFGAMAAGDAALPAALWLIEQDTVADNEEAGAQALTRIDSSGANDSIGRIIAEVHPNQVVLATALQEAGKRRLTACKEGVVALEQSYRKAVRVAAVAAAAQLGQTSPTAYDPLKALSPQVLDLLKACAERIGTAVPAGTAWLDGIEQPMWSPGQPFPVHGWLLGKDGDKTTFLDTFGQVRTVTESPATAAAQPPGTFLKSVTVAFTPGTLAGTAQHFAQLRAEVAEEKRQYEAFGKDPAFSGNDHDKIRILSNKTGQLWRDMDAKLKEMTTYRSNMGPPGGKFVNLPEVNVAAWCWQQGDLTDAARVILPCFDAARDDRWVEWAARDAQADIYHQEMLDKFTQDRDYAGALALATQLSKPAFNGYYYQARAKELAAQLAARGEDFKTLALPLAEEWAAQQAKLSREQQIVYLASRLKLLHCVQPGQPAFVRYNDPQFANPCLPFMPPKNDPKVINPFTELEKLQLTTNDLLTLAPFATDEDYLLTYSYWRDFTPERQLHRVSWVVGALINETAGQALVQTTDGGISFDPKKGADVTADLKAWVVAHPNMSQADLLAETLKTSTDWKVLQQGAQSALQLKRSNVLRALTDRLGSMVVQKNDYYAEGQLAKTIFRSGLPLAPEARGWVKSPNPELRFWAALILVRDGDVKNGEGLDVLEQYLESSPGVEGYLQAAETLLASPSRKASAVTVGVFQPKYYESLRESSFRGSDLLKRYFLAGKKECCDFLMAQMDDLKVDPNVISSSGRPAFLSDALVDQISCWYDVRNSYGEAMNKSETEEKLYRAKLKLWLVAQFALVQAGQKCAIRPPQSDLNYVTFIDQR